jgi:hypothetical protein
MLASHFQFIVLAGGAVSFFLVFCSAVLFDVWHFEFCSSMGSHFGVAAGVLWVAACLLQGTSTLALKQLAEKNLKKMFSTVEPAGGGR